MINHGLREHHKLLDIGCGSLRGGRLFIPYLLPKRYFGIEPEQWLIDEGIKHNIGQDLIRIKKPKFSNVDDFSLDIFGTKFDFILAQSIFSHTGIDLTKKILSKVKEVLKEDGLFLATFRERDTSTNLQGWFYNSKNIERVQYTLDFMGKMITESGLFFKKLDFPHPNNQTWIVIFKEANKNNISVI